jgi:hypothetical protein
MCDEGTTSNNNLEREIKYQLFLIFEASLPQVLPSEI